METINNDYYIIAYSYSKEPDMIDVTLEKDNNIITAQFPLNDDVIEALDDAMIEQAKKRTETIPEEAKRLLKNKTMSTLAHLITIATVTATYLVTKDHQVPLLTTSVLAGILAASKRTDVENQTEYYEYLLKQQLYLTNKKRYDQIVKNEKYVNYNLDPSLKYFLESITKDYMSLNDIIELNYDHLEEILEADQEYEQKNKLRRL